MTKQIEVECPCCSHLLTVDVLTGKVLRTVRPAERSETGKVVLDEGRWDEAEGRVQERREGARDRMEEALSKERRREEDLNDLFDKARQRALGRGRPNPLEGPPDPSAGRGAPGDPDAPSNP